MENKKTKLTISGSPKKSFKSFGQSKTLGKKTVIIDKQSNKYSNKGNYNRSSNLKAPSSNFKKNTSIKPNFTQKISSTTSNDFERHKLAEQRATKRLKGDIENKEKKSKLGQKKENLNLLFREP